MTMETARCGLLMCVLLLSLPLAADARTKPNPLTYGGVTLDPVSPSKKAPVRFDHWLHRSQFTCRLCHVDIGFAMQANATGITADTNIKGFYCGACHNGIRTHKGKKIFSSCSVNPAEERSETCDRCHGTGKNKSREYDYGTFSKLFPKNVLDNLINWEEAETKGLIEPVNYLEGVSIARKPLTPQEDFFIASKSTWMPDIIFSHKKHAVWNGCEVCHPEIFPSARKGTVKFSMLQISGGEYCGLCHGRVAFCLNNCERCHLNSTRK